MTDKEKTENSVASAEVVPLDLKEVDRVFAEPAPQGDFKFNTATVKVFDDMVSRSVPFYEEMQRMTGEMAADFAQPNTNLYDFGCSTATTMALIDPQVDPTVRFIGFDNSQPMLDKAREKLTALGVTRQVDLVNADLHSLPALENASISIVNLTLQFVRPLFRDKLLRAISSATNENGCLIMIEKLTTKDSRLNRLFIQYYYEMKRRRGYSDTEITQKREALENVLIPYRLEENIELIKSAGFGTAEVFFNWYNFCGIIAVK